MTRNKRAVINGAVGVVRQIVVFICGFILPRYLLRYYGSSVNGLISSITQFLGLISLLEMGVGPVIQASLYKPLAERDMALISQIVKSASILYRRIGYIFLVYLGILFFAFPRISNSTFEPWFVSSLVLIISISTIAQYFFGATYQALLNASQLGYIQNGLQVFTVILNTAVSVVLIRTGCSIQLVKLVSSVIFLIRPFVQIWYVNKHFEIDRNIKLNGEPIKQKWSGFAQHLAGWVCSGTDNVVLTLFSTLENLSVYSVYYSITIGITNMVITAASGIEAMFGDMIARKETDTLVKSFRFVEFIVHTGVTVIFAVAAAMIVPFVSVYTSGITDVNYHQPIFGVLIVVAYALQAIRVPYARMIHAAGRFRETQTGPVISAVINIVVTTALVISRGFIGTAIGTLLAMLYHTLYYVNYLKHHILRRSVSVFLKQFGVDVLVFFCAFLCSSVMPIDCRSYWTWSVWSVVLLMITIGISAVCNYTFYREESKRLLKMVRDFASRRIP